MTSIFTAVALGGIDEEGDALLDRFVIEAPDQQSARNAVLDAVNSEEMIQPIDGDWKVYAITPGEPCPGPETYNRVRVTGPDTWEWAV